LATPAKSGQNPCSRRKRCDMDEELGTQRLLRSLTVRIDDPVAYGAALAGSGKQLRRQFQRLVDGMHVSDELWEFNWREQIGSRWCYSLGWAVLRDGQLVTTLTHSTS